MYTSIFMIYISHIFYSLLFSLILDDPSSSSQKGFHISPIQRSVSPYRLRNKRHGKSFLAALQ